MIDSIIKFLGGYTQEEYNKMRAERNIAVNSFENGFPEPVKEDIKVNDYVWYFCYEEGSTICKYKKAIVTCIENITTSNGTITLYTIRFIEPCYNPVIKFLKEHEISKTAVGMRTKVLNSNIFHISKLEINEEE